MYQWFNRVTGVSDQQSEPKLTFEKDETLWCTPHGQVAELHSRTVFAFTKAKSETLSRERGRPSGTKLLAAVRETLHIPERAGIPDFRILRPLRSRSYPAPHAVNYVVETEPGIQAIVYRLSEEPLMSRPPQGQTRAVLYVSHHSADDELRNEPLVRELYAREKGAAFFAVDPRGIGDSRPDTCGADSFLNPYGSDYFYAIHSLMLDYPYVGQKTFDLLRVLDWFGDLGHTEVHLVAKGWGTIPATFAALLSPAVTQVTLKNALASYSAIAESEDYDWPLSTFIPGVLEKFDLPDCYRELQSKNPRMIETWPAVQKS
jgi:hypothetical protein